MVCDMQAMSADNLEEQSMTGSAGYERQVTELVDVVASMNDNLIDDGISQKVLTTDTAEYQYSTTNDRQWLRANHQSTPYNV